MSLIPKLLYYNVLLRDIFQCRLKDAESIRFLTTNCG